LAKRQKPKNGARFPDISIHAAAREGNIEAIKQHLAAGTDVNAKNDSENIPLYYATNFGHKEVAELLIAKGADVNAKADDGFTPLHRAALGGHKEIAEILIAEGADVNAKDAGTTPLDVAEEFNLSELASILRKHGGKTKKELEAEGN